LAAAFRRPEPDRVLPPLEPHGPEQPDHAEEVVGVHVRDEDVVDAEAGAEPHHLPLRAFPAVEEEQLPLAVDHQRTDVAADGRPAGCCTEKGDADHLSCVAPWRRAGPARGWSTPRRFPG